MKSLYHLYQIYNARKYKKEEISISDLVLMPEECLVWALAARTAEQIEQGEYVSLFDLQRYPLAANYTGVGSVDIRDKILVQDYFRHKGPYVLNQRNSTVFQRRNLSGVGQPEIVQVHVAGDKIPVRWFYFAGDPQVLFLELEEKGYRFEG